MSKEILVVFGASDPETAAAERLAVECGCMAAHATCDGSRVHPGNAYRADGMSVSGAGVPRGWTHGGGDPLVVLFECDFPGGLPVPGNPEVVRCDHHREGDPGFGRDPSEFLAASSIGQLLVVLAERGALRPSLMGPVTDIGRAVGTGEIALAPQGWTTIGIGHDPFFVPEEIVLCAAADHCLSAAYRGDCPGVDPDELMRWRAESRAAFQGRPVDEVLADIDSAIRKIRVSRDFYGTGYPVKEKRIRTVAEPGELYPGKEVTIQLGMDDGNGAGWCSSHATYSGRMVAYNHPGFNAQEWAVIRNGVVDLRGETIPELPEAACRLGVPVLAGPMGCPDGRRKVVLQAADGPTIERFLRGEIAPELADRYGDPARGFAGGYLPADD